MKHLADIFGPRFHRVVRTALLAIVLLASTALANGKAGLPKFEDIASQAGVDLVHSSRKFTGKHKEQILALFTDGGAIAAAGDYNNDGYYDLFLVDSGEGKPNHLMRNNGDLTFTDVAGIAGVAGGNEPEALTSDALFFDYDNDGLLDILVSRMGTPLFYRNEGPGEDGEYRFVEISKRVGLTRHGNTVTSIAFDANADGYLDVLIGYYFQDVNLFNLDRPNVLPNNFDYADNGGGLGFFLNEQAEDGSRHFVDATEKAGFAHHTGWSLDLGHGDLDNDGDQDVYLAADYGTDRLFINRGDGVFDDKTEEAMGWDTKKGMNAELADFNRDGYLDIYVTNITDDYMKECNMLWHNNGDGTFIDVSRESGTCDTDWGWAAKFGDFDNDGWEDLFAVNGMRSAGEENYIPHLLEMILTPDIDYSDINNYPDIKDMTWSGYQKQRFFYNQGDGTFKEIGAEAGVDNDLDGRGVAVADFDNDGLLDIFQGSVNRAGILYHNRTDNPGNWVQLKLVGTESNRDAIGARVVLVAGGETYMREVNGGNGYSGQSATRLHFGVAGAKRVESIEIRWPSGLVEKLTGKDGETPVPMNAVTTLREGEGVAVATIASKPTPGE